MYGTQALYICVVKGYLSTAGVSIEMRRTRIQCRKSIIKNEEDYPALVSYCNNIPEAKCMSAVLRGNIRTRSVYREWFLTYLVLRGSQSSQDESSMGIEERRSWRGCGME